MSYSEIMAKYKASQLKVEKLNLQLEGMALRINQSVADEKALQTQLLRELQTALSGEIGQDVRIGGTKAAVAVVEAKAEPYRRDEILARIVQLKDTDKASYEAIAETLNSEGFKPLSAAKFSHATVYQLYKTRQKPVVTAVGGK